MIEGDFYGSGGGTFRLRHAYGEWNGLLAGQTWTNFGGFLGMTPTIDFTGQVGQANIGRQAQLRYTIDGFSIALEEPTAIGGAVAAGEDGESKNSLPHLTLRYQGGVGDFNYAASAVVREVEYYNTDEDSDKGSTGWGLNLEASAKVAEGVTLRGSVTHGDGLGSYMYGNPYGPGYVNADGGVSKIKGTGGTAGISIAAGDGNVNLGYGIATADLDDALADGIFVDADGEPTDPSDKFESVYLNYIWSPVRNVTYGIEAGWHSRDTVRGNDGDAVRVQGMVQYNF